MRPRHLSSSLPEEAAAPLAGCISRSLEAPCPPAAGRLGAEPAAGCASRPPASLANGSCDSEAPLPPLSQPRVPLPPLSQPRAAAVVPEIQQADKATVAQSVSVGQPHPPPSFYQPQAAGALCPSAPVPVEKADCGLAPNGPAAPPDAPAASAAAPCPSAIPQDSEVLLGHTGDHINFFSAREKFKGMSQDGRGCQLRSCAREPQPQPQPQELLQQEAKEDEGRKVGAVTQLLPENTRVWLTPGFSSPSVNLCSCFVVWRCSFYCYVRHHMLIRYL